MKYIKLFEEFEEFKKPSLFHKVLKGTKKFLGVENKEDRKELEKIHRMIDNSAVSSEDFTNLIKDVKEIKPDVIVANFINGNLLIDNVEKTIMFKGKELELNDIEYECQSLYDRLKYFLRNSNQNESFSMYREFCDRCKEPTDNVTTQSIFNEEVICMKCKEEEKKDPEYKAAEAAELEEVRKGNYNYRGIMPNYKPLIKSKI